MLADCIFQAKATEHLLVDVLHDPTQSTIQNRVKNSQHVEGIVNQFATLSRQEAMAGRPVEGNIYDALRQALQSALEHFFRDHKPKLVCVEDAVNQHRNMKRIVAEVRACYQVLDVSDPNVHLTTSVWSTATACYNDDSRKRFLQLFLLELSRDRIKNPLEPDEKYLRPAACSLSMYNNLLPKAQQTGGNFETNVVKPVLTAVRNYYNAIKMHPDLDVYLTFVNDSINAELKRVATVFAEDERLPTLLGRVKREIQHVMLGDRCVAIAADERKGVKAQLQYPNLNAKRFKELFNVLDFSVPCIRQMETQVRQAAVAAVTTLPPGLPLEPIIDIRCAFGELLGGVPQEHRLGFHLELQEGLSQCLNTQDFELQLSLHYDKLIKSKPSDVQTQLSRFMHALPLIKDTDAFFQHYRSHLASRLTVRTHTHFTTEALAISSLTTHFGTTFTHPLQIILEEAHKGHPLQCNAAVWPETMPWVQRDLCLPPQLQGAIDQVPHPKAPPASTHTSMDLAATTVEVSLEFPGSPHACLVQGTVPQMAVLETLLSSSCGAMSLNEVAAEVVVVASPENDPLGAEKATSDLKLILKTLVSSKLVIAVAPPGVATQYEINSSFMAGATSKKKMLLPTMGIAKSRHAIQQ